MRHIGSLSPRFSMLARGGRMAAVSLGLLLSGFSIIILNGAARAGVITYTFGAPNNNAGTMAIGYPLTFPPAGGVSTNFAVDNTGKVITFNVGAAPAETLATKQTSIVNFIKANLPNTFTVATPANNQVQITIPKADIAKLAKGEVAGIGVMATNGVETEGILRAKIQANGDPPIGAIDFDGVFASSDQTGVASTFDAGIFSSFGSFDDQLSYSDFSGLDGKTIAEKFLADFQPRASSLHVSLGFFSSGPDDGQIIVTFLNAPLGSDDGISFGSTSKTGVVVGAMGAIVPEVPTWAMVLVGFASVGLTGFWRARPSRASSLTAVA